MTAPSDKSAVAWIKQRPWKSALFAGVGGAIAISLLAMARDLTELSLLIPPFGATCVLAFGFPASPFAQAKNIIGGHVLSAIMGLLACWLFGYGIAGVAVGVGLAIAVMMVTDTVHPPAGANPVVVALTHPGLSFLALPVLTGAVTIVVLEKIYTTLLARVGWRLPVPPGVQRPVPVRVD